MPQDANGLNQLDARQVTRAQAKCLENGQVAQSTVIESGLITDSFDHIDLTYVTAGNGIGEIETVTYKDGGPGGTTVGILTLAYDVSSRLISVTRS